jgi:Fuc2NAc and GlcNAc transferase
VFAAAIAAAASLLAIFPIRRHAALLGLLDAPNERSSHRVVTPRGGGLGIFLGTAAGALAMWWSGAAHSAVWMLFASAAILATIGFLDDRHNLSPGLRLFAQISAAAFIVRGFGPISALPLPSPFNLPLSAPVFGWMFSILWLVAFTNFFNFMDGIDGLAGGQAIASGAGVILAGWSGDATSLAAVMSGACLGFLFHNWPAARVFMGDTGSGFLGFTIAALPFLAPFERNGDAAMAIAIGMALFLLDPVFTLIRRARAGKNIFRAHREHLYQQLVGPEEPAARVTAAYTCTAVMLAVVGAIGYRVPAVAWIGCVLALAAFLVVWRLAAARENVRP